MDLFLASDSIVRRVLTVFIIVDTSKSMFGQKIQAVNDAMASLLPTIRSISSRNANAEIKIACLDFSTGSRWMTEKPESVEVFEFVPLKACGRTELGDALIELESKLHIKDGWMGYPGGSYAPVFILLSDGGPSGSYKQILKSLNENKWFKAGTKIAIAIGNDAHRDVLARFTNNPRAVFTVHDKNALKEIIQFVSVTSSSIASQSRNIGNSDTQSQVIEAIQKKKNKGTGLGVDIGVDVVPSIDEWN